MRNGFVSAIFVGSLLGLLALQAIAQSKREIDTEKSVMTVRVYKTGLFSGFAHNHEIHAPVANGSFDEQQPAVEFRVQAASLRVVDPGVSESERSQVQSNMLGPKVLDTQKFTEIAFRSTQIEKISDGKWVVSGDLTLHGVTKAVKVNVEGGDGRYRGDAQLRQRDFGITPISIGGGAVKVKDEVRVEFEIVGK
jgi:polyisoprenoid-binding protein YceI